MNGEQESANALVISYLALRRVIGILGTLLPFLLFFGALIIFGTGIQDSISAYYHTDMGDVLVGVLFAMGFFLLSYRGYKPVDNKFGNLGFVFALGVALFPTPPESPSRLDVFIGYAHFAFAGLFFLTLIYFSLCLFTKTHPNRPPTPMKLKRNRVYWACGYTMLLCIVLIVVFYVLPAGVRSIIAAHSPVFWLEAIAIVAFGISWLTKGEALLRDEA
ncbi:MAG: DUF998 domain-containing protein [bacterium]|nr:DUF998 domain-containing protein [bacterium]